MRGKSRQILLTCCLLVNIGIISVMRDLSIASPDQPTIAVAPKISSVAPGGFFTIDVTVSDLTAENAQPVGLLAWQVNVTFNPDILNVSAVAEGPFLKNVGNTWWLPSTIDNDNGFVFVGASLFPVPAEGAYGSGVLANITFQVENEGQTNLDFDSETTMTASGDGTTSIVFPSSTVGGTFRYPTLRDVAVTGVTFSPSSVPAGGTVSINVTVENKGNVFDETFDVSVSYDSSLIGTKTVTDLAPGASQIVSFSWDTSGVAEGSYTITAVATTVPDETETGDNTYESSNTVEVTAPQTTLPVELVIGAIAVIAVIGVGVFLLLKRRSAKT